MAKKPTSLPDAVPTVGSVAPDFTLPADDGSMVRLSDLRGRRVVLYFYPKDDTPGCTTQACGFRDNYVEITEKDAVVFGISPDGVSSHVKFRTKFDLPFRLLADEDHKVAELYGCGARKPITGRRTSASSARTLSSMPRARSLMFSTVSAPRIAWRMPWRPCG